MHRWAVIWAENLLKGGLVYLTGPMGAGKTTLASFLINALGSEDLVTSPTFALVHEYSGPLKIFHIDLYRLHSTQEFWALGGEDYLAEGALCLIEWPDRVRDELPAPRWELALGIQTKGRSLEVLP